MFSKLTAVLVTISVLASSALAAAPPLVGGGIPPSEGASQQINLSYEYDVSAQNFRYVACSDQLTAKGFSTFGSLPSWPFIAGAKIVSPHTLYQCGACYQVSYENESVYVTLVDSAAEGFALSYPAFNQLTGGKAGQPLFQVNGTVRQVDASHCGL